MRGKPVTSEEISRIKHLRLLGLSIYDIGKQVNRAPSFIYQRIKALGLSTCLDRTGNGKKIWRSRKQKFGQSGCSPEGLQKRIKQCREQFSGEHNPSHRADVRQKISLAQKGVPCPQRGRKGKIISLAQRQRLSESAKKRFADSRNHPLYGKLRSEESKEKQRKAMTGRKLTKEQKQKIGSASKRVWSKLGFKEMMREKGRKNAAELWSRPEFIEKMKRLMSSPKFKKAISEGLRQSERFNNLEAREKRIKATMKATHKKPNGSEAKLDNFLQRLFPNEYKYVGDGSFIIAGKCPDFVNVNGQKKIIELFGVVYHNPEKAFFKVPYEQTEDGRVKLFKRYGFDTLIVWDSELDNVPVLSEKLMVFHSGEQN